MDVILPAVDARNVHLSYSKKTPVLQGVDLLVKRGHIYGLLGPSGCGKTTLLKVVIGRLKASRGRVHVLGHKPGTYESGIPGSKVGYMPQELALYQSFTVSETLHFFGRVHNMTKKQIRERTTFLLSFLDLPPASRKVSQLSGGQQRRVSLAVALLHSPDILILDEPTVGVDPLLRQRIWDHLVGISTANQTSIIITTHYIEEARSANTVGLMRSGRILAEGPPDLLLERFNQSSLEDVFLHLCVLDDQNSGVASMERGVPKKVNLNDTQISSDAPPPDVIILDPNSDVTDDDVRLLGRTSTAADNCSVSSRRTRAESTASYVEENTCAHTLRGCCSNFPKPRNLRALVIKNLNSLKTQIGFLLFQFLLPAIQITIYCLSIGGTPKHLPVRVVNLDQGMDLHPIFNCTLSISHAFIEELDHDVLDIKYSADRRDANMYIKNGTAWATLEFGTDFTKDTILRIQNASNPEAVNGSILHTWLDATNQQITLTIKSQIFSAYQNLSTAINKQADKCKLPNLNSSSAEIPIDYEPPIYGLADATFLDFVAPGIVCSIIYFLAIGLTTLSLVSERKEGLFERCLVSGVTITEMMIGHIATQFLVMSIQLAVLLIFTFIIYDVYNAGPMLVVILFALLLGFMGMCLGFLISTVTSDEREATQLSLALVFPFLLISGILWPIEAMPQWLQYISVALPLTLAVEGLRAVVGRGWDMTYFVVWRGFSIAAAWSIGMLLIALLAAKVKRLN